MLPKKKWKKPSPGSDPSPLEKRGSASPSEKDLMDLALQALARRAFSSTELFFKLEQAGAPEILAKRIISRLRTFGYLDDRKYVEAYLQARRGQKSMGRIRIIRELQLKGLQTELIEAVLNSSYPEEEEETTLNRALEKKCRSLPSRVDSNTGIDAKILARLYNYLFRLGFPSDKIQRALRKKFRADPDWES